MTTEGTQTETNGTEISFDEMFKQFSAVEDGATPPKAEEAPAGEPAKPAEEAVKAEEVPAEPAPAAEEPPKAEDAPAPAPAPQADTEDVLQRLAKMMKEAPASEPAPQPEVQEPAIYTAEEQEFLKSYEKDWPDVSKAERLARRAEYKELVTYVFGEVAKSLSPIVDTVQTLAQRTHASDLRSSVTDYEDVRDKVIDWVETQPAYLQIAYKHVIQNGTVEDVADLVSRYKRETGVATAPAGDTPAPVKKETELPSATKKAAAALAPVSSKRAAVVTSAEPDTFEDAFAAFASKM